jgi:hypothetical protein
MQAKPKNVQLTDKRFDELFKWIFRILVGIFTFFMQQSYTSLNKVVDSNQQIKESMARMEERDKSREKQIIDYKKETDRRLELIEQSLAARTAAAIQKRRTIN